jgi:hypothetical protein
LWVTPALLHGLQAAFDRDLALERFRLQGRSPGETRSGERSTYGTVTRKDEGRSGTLDGLLLGAGGPERSAIGPEQEQGIRSRLPALLRQQQREQMSAAALPPARRSGRAATVGS